MTTEGMSRQLEVGDYLPLFQGPDQKARLNVLWNHMMGLPIVLLFYRRHDLPACQRILRGFAERFAALSERAQVFAISGESTESNAAAAGTLGFGFPILTDQGLRIAGNYGVAHNRPAADDMFDEGAFSSFIADPNRQILQINRRVSDPDHAEAVLRFLESQPREEPRMLGRFAPVLYLPRVFDGGFCRQLIDRFETEGSVSTGVMRDSESGARADQLDAGKKVRRDYFVEDDALNRRIEDLMGRRVLPEIFKAFAYRVTRHERFKVVRYDAETGGHFYPHRDNNNISAVHRRFAMTLNLNAGEYAGGCLRFPEYGPQLYRPDTGDAVIFSCSLLHEATVVTEGRRYVLLCFFFGEEAQRMREQRKSGLGRA
jgi:peroxiredoxin/predicted 2-oxoglutarate/Fe(II)-dependent dioxygenase YbiX